MTVNVKVMTFKKSGKFYDEFTVSVNADETNWYHTVDAVRKYKPNHEVQTDMDWLIGYTEEGLPEEIANGVYPIILKG